MEPPYAVFCHSFWLNFIEFLETVAQVFGNDPLNSRLWYITNHFKISNKFAFIKLIDKKLPFELAWSCLIKSISISLTFWSQGDDVSIFLLIIDILLVWLIILFMINGSSEKVDERVWMLYFFSSWNSATHLWVSWSICYSRTSRSSESSNSNGV